MKNGLNASTHSYLSLLLGWAGDTDAAVVALKRGIELTPGGVEWNSYLARFQTLQGLLDDAAASAEREPSDSYRLFSRALVLLARKDRPAADRMINELIEKYCETMNTYVAELYAFAGEPDRAFEWLERARTRRETAIAWVKGWPTFRPLHTDPRWPAFLKKIGLADEQLK